MENQEIFDMLSGLEAALYYRKQTPDGINPADLEQLHALADYMLLKWHKLTGCVNQ